MMAFLATLAGLAAAVPVAIGARKLATSPRNAVGSVVLDDMTRGYSE